MDGNTGNNLLSDRLFEYDGQGRLIKEGLDVNASGGLLQDTSNDRMTAYDTWYVKDGWGWVRYATAKTAPETTAGGSNGVRGI